MEYCTFRLLGGMKMSIAGEVLRGVPGGKMMLLLAYIVLAEDGPVPRKRIAFDFWPESTEKQALSNLRKLLHDLREHVPRIERYLEVTPVHIRWREELAGCVDVRDFERAAKGSSLDELRRAAELYRGELLAGFYEGWVASKRELLAQTYSNVLDKLVAVLESRRDYSSALLYANKLLLHDKWREESYRTLMRLYASMNDSASLKRIYRQARDVLQAELGIDPSEETVQLWERLSRRGEGRSANAGFSNPLVGRFEEWRALEGAWKEAAIGNPALLILKGEAGIGKTRLANEFRCRMESLGAQTAFAGCYPSVSSLSYLPVKAWLRSLPLTGTDPADLSELSRLLPELSDGRPELPKPAPITESWQLNSWYEAIERMLLARPPVLLVLDDLQWCDGETLQLLSYLLRGGTRAKLLVVATMRTDERPGDAANLIAANLREEKRLTEIELAPLGEEETKSLIAGEVGRELANLHASGMYADTGGNPLFIVETLREWRLNGSAGEIRLAALARTIIANRLEKLSPEQRRLASAIAAVGRPVTAEFAALLTNEDDEAALERIEQLTQAKILQESENGKYGFTHEVVREAAYALILGGRRQRCHGLIARSLADFHRGRPEAVFGEIAFHYELAGMDEDAVVYYELAASAAEKIYANDTRIQYYKKLCALLPPERILPVLMKLGDALIVVGQWSEAESTYRQWLDRSGNAAGLAERSFCDLALGNCLRLQGKYEEAKEYLDRAERCFELTGDPSGLDAVYVALGLLHYYKGNFDRVLAYQDGRTKLPPDVTRERDHRFYGIIGHVYYDQCEYEQAVFWIQRQLRLASDRGDQYTVGQAMGTLAMVSMDMDEMDRAYELLADKTTISRSIGDRMGFANALCMLGKYYGHLGLYEPASGCLSFGLAEAVAIEDWRVAAIALSYEGRHLLARNRLTEAELLIGRAIGLFERLRTPYFACESLYYQSLLMRRLGQSGNAADTAEKALRMADRLGRKDMQVHLRVQLSLLNAEANRISKEQALLELEGLSESYPQPQHRAAVSYALWRLRPDSSDDRSAALRLNEALGRKSGKREYLVRCGELGGGGLPAASRPMPRLAAEAAQGRTVTPELLAAIDRSLKEPSRFEPSRPFR